MVPTFTTAVFQGAPTTNALFVVLRDTGAKVAEIAGLRVTDCSLDEGYINITPTPWRTLEECAFGALCATLA